MLRKQRRLKTLDTRFKYSSNEKLPREPANKCTYCSHPPAPQTRYSSHGFYNYYCYHPPSYRLCSAAHCAHRRPLLSPRLCRAGDKQRKKERPIQENAQ